MGNFYCLMSGLPELTLDNTEKVIAVEEVKGLIDDEQDISKRDARIISTFFLEADCKNLIQILKGQKGEATFVGNYSCEELEEMMDAALEDPDNDDPRFPAFLQDFVREYAERKDDDGYFLDDAVMHRYWEYVAAAKDEVVSEWGRLNLNISNILTALIARQQGWTLADYVKGEDDVTEMILSSKSKDFDLGREFDFVSSLMQIVDCDNPVDKERRIDALKWMWLDDQTFMDSFTVSALYAYLCKVQMLERWTRLDPVFGRERFETIIENLRSEARVPAEFQTTSVYTKKY